MKRQNMCLLAVCAAWACAATSAIAQYVPVDMSSYFNEGRTTFINGSMFPTGNQFFIHGSNAVPVAMSNAVSDADLWTWAANTAASWGHGTVGLNIPVNIPGAVSVFTMINTFWGNANPIGYASVTFHATGGLSQTFVLVGNEDIRDYNLNFNYTTTINGTSTQQVWANGHNQWLDMQRFDLAPAFAAETLTSIEFSDYGAPSFQRIFVSGVTVMVPAPGSVALVGLAGLAAVRRRR